MFNLSAYIDREVSEQRSTRAISLFRIAIAGLIYMRFGAEMSLHLAQSLEAIILSLAFFMFTTLMLVGLFTRVAVAGTTIVLGYMYFILGVNSPTPGWGHHHHYMLFWSSFLLAFAPCGKSFSLDRALAIRRADLDRKASPEELGPGWVQTLLVFQMAALYFWTAIDKTNLEFLRGDRLERIFEWVYAGTPLYDLLTARWFLATGSTAVVLIEYILPFMLVFRWRLPWAFAIAFLLHAGFYVMLPVQTYSATMLSMYILVADPKLVHEFIDRYILGKRAYVPA